MSKASGLLSSRQSSLYTKSRTLRLTDRGSAVSSDTQRESAGVGEPYIGDSAEHASMPREVFFLGFRVEGFLT